MKARSASRAMRGTSAGRVAGSLLALGFAVALRALNARLEQA